MDDYVLGDYCVCKDLKPIWTCWSHDTVRDDIKAHKRRSRRAYRQYLKTGDVRDLNRANRKVSRRDFD